MICCDAVAKWAGDKRKLLTIEQVDAAGLEPRMKAGAVTVIDVRARSEWDAGHLPGVPNIPLGYLEDHWKDLIRPASLLDNCTIDGKIYCVPINIHSWEWLWLSKASPPQMPRMPS